MELRSILVACLGIGTLLSVGAVGCGDDTGDGAAPQNVVPAVKSRRGESCAARNDCVDGLSCIHNQCIESDYPVDPTAKECVLVECLDSAQCCAGFVPDSSCAFYQEQCQLGDELYCQDYQSFCVCNAQCVEEQCVFAGSGCTAEQCAPFFCVQGSCVECTVNENCTAGLTCVNNSCQPGCLKNEECALFNSCQNGQCVETGCTSDRECILFTGRPDAICKEAVCTVACETNVECPELEACVDGKCTFIGCETDAECKTALHVEYSDVLAVCRDAVQ